MSEVDQHPGEDMKKPNVLVIEDSSTVRHMIGDNLVARGHQVSLASSTDEALNMFEELQASVVDGVLKEPFTSEDLARLVGDPR